MKGHPEQQDDEFFLGNTREGIPEHLAALKSMRLGDVAYDIEGNRIPPEWNYRPMFVGRADYDECDRIKMANFRAIRREQY